MSEEEMEEEDVECYLDSFDRWDRPCKHYSNNICSCEEQEDRTKEN